MCRANITAHGGKGKVIVVGYSMGGLVARDALSRRSTDNTRAIADEVGQVITIGTPHVGTTLPLAGGIIPRTLLAAFTPGSAELERLPHFPTQTVVHTIAGDVVRIYHDKKGTVTKQERPYDDTLVSTISAHAEYTIDVTKGGGDHTIQCEKSYWARGFSLGYASDKNPTPCEHTQLINNASNGVREDTVSAIKKYINSLSTVSLTIGSLTTYFDNRWSHVTYGAFGPGNDGWGNDMTSGVPCTNCTTLPNPTTYASANIYYYRMQCSDAALRCALPYEQIVGSAPSVTIGGRTPDYSARYLDSGYLGTSFVWCFSDRGLCVYYRRPADTPQLEPSQALLDLFRSATWSH